MKIRLMNSAAVILMIVVTGLRASGAESFTVNGLKVIIGQNAANDIVAASMFFRGGSTFLTLKQAGIEGMALTLATKATEHYPKDRLNQALESMDTRITVTTTVDYSSLNLLCVRQNFPASWDIFADMFLSPVMSQQDVDLERQRMLTQINQSKDNPDSYLNSLAARAFFVNHPYDVDVNGTPESVSAFTSADLKDYLRGRLTTSQMLLVVVGNTTRADVERMVKKSFGALPPGSYRAAPPPQVRHEQPSVKVVERDLPTDYIVGLFPAPSFASTESYAMQIAGSVLRDRLFEEVRTKRGLSYAPAGGTGSSFSGYGYVYVTAVKPDTTVKVMLAELKRLKESKLSGKELTDKLNGFIISYYLQNESNQSQVSALARYELAGVGYQEADSLVANLVRVSPDEVQAVCRKYIGNLQFVLIGNPASLQVRNFMY